MKKKTLGQKRSCKKKLERNNEKTHSKNKIRKKKKPRKNPWKNPQKIKPWGKTLQKKHPKKNFGDKLVVKINL